MPLINFSNPLHLLLAALAYVFGASIADYLGKPFLAGSFWLGMLAVLLAQTVMNQLAEVFRLDVAPLRENETRSKRQILRNNVLYSALACIVVFGVTSYILFANNALSRYSSVFFFLSFVILVVYSVPPLHFINRGAGEFMLATHLAYVIPSIAFTLQAGETHLFLALCISLTLLAFSYFIVRNFLSFAQDQKSNRVTFLTRLGWERVVPMHHLLVGLAYVLFASSPLLGLSLRVIWPVFLTLPFAIIQIFLLRSISFGAKPNWTLLHATALAVFGLTIYFLTLTFWLR